MQSWNPGRGRTRSHKPAAAAQDKTEKKRTTKIKHGKWQQQPARTAASGSGNCNLLGVCVCVSRLSPMQTALAASRAAAATTQGGRHTSGVRSNSSRRRWRRAGSAGEKEEDLPGVFGVGLIWEMEYRQRERKKRTRRREEQGRGCKDRVCGYLQRRHLSLLSIVDYIFPASWR